MIKNDLMYSRKDQIAHHFKAMNAVIVSELDVLQNQISSMRNTE